MSMSTPRSAAPSEFVPAISHSCTPHQAGDSPTPAGRSRSGSYVVTTFYPESWRTHDLVCTLKELSFCFPPPCGIPGIKLHWSLNLDSLGLLLLLLGSPMWGSELSLLWQNFCGIIVFQSVGHPSEYGICFYRGCVPSTIRWLLLCL